MRSEAISSFLQSRIDAGDFPSAVYLVAEKGEIIFQDALGLAVVEPERIPAGMDTIYDLASLTKVLVTGLLLAKLIESGEIGLGDRVGSFFPRFDGSRMTLLNLVTHTSGLAAWRPMYLLARDGSVQVPAYEMMRANLTRLIAAEPSGNPLNSKVVYSDLNYLILTQLIEKLSGARLDEVAKAEIFDPLSLEDTFFNPAPEMRQRIAASEKGNEFEKQTCVDAGYDISGFEWRDYQIWGEVHDGNAWFLDGVSGHAGLFSTAEETFRIAGQFLSNSTQILKPESCKLFRTNFTPTLNEGRSLGFQLAVTRDTAGDALPKEAFGHLGFTGTSLWIDPVNERIFISLTNRTHNHPLPFQNINSVRRRFHDTAAKLLDEHS
jgi:CubicO group peptidase (beta-lactamase class C family)